VQYDMPYHGVARVVEAIGQSAMDKLVECGYVLVPRDFMEAFRAGRVIPVEDDKLKAMQVVVEAAKRWRKLATIDVHMDLARAVDRLEALEHGGERLTAVTECACLAVESWRVQEHS
jgi:hypothetical protein